MVDTDRIVAEDRALENGASRASEQLAGHRWHWTLDESNPDRLSVREYARLVERALSTVQAQVNGYAAWVTGPDRSGLDEQIGRATAGVEREAVIDAVAKARGVSFQYVRKTRANEVSRIRQLAREKAEEKGTSVEVEAPQIAAMAAKYDEAQIRVRDERVARRTLRYVEIEGYLLAALRPLAKAVALAGQDWDSEERELLKDSVHKIRTVLVLLDGRITGTPAIDWDAELATIMEQVS